MPSSKVGSAHVNARISKAQATAHFMQRKGLHAGGLNLSVCIFIFKTVIVSSLLYGMEVMQISDAEFNNLDYFMASILAKILHNGPMIGPPSWTLWEAGCLPSKILISIAAHRLLRKMSTSSTIKSNAANLILGKGFASKFFWDYINQMEPFYPPSSSFEGLHDINNLPSKRKLNEALKEASTNWFADIIEEKYGTVGLALKWDMEIQPHILFLPKSDRKIILKTRSKHISLMGKEVPICSLCSKRSPASLVHLLSQCNFPPLQKISTEIITMLEGVKNNLSSKWINLSHEQQTNILLGADWNSPLGPKIKLINIAASLVNKISEFPSVFSVAIA
jgi:hypothetical protein